MKKPYIQRVIVERKQDTDPDLSYLGEYSNKPGRCAIDREANGDRGSGEFRYFNCAMTGEESGNPNSPQQDYERMEAYNRGGWCCIGIIAKAQVVLPSGVVQVIRSGGLWGIESDSDSKYFDEVEREQLAELREDLASIGCGRRNIAYMFKHVENSDR